MSERRMIYVVTSGEYSDYHIVAVFDSEERAREWIAAPPQWDIGNRLEMGNDTHYQTGQPAWWYAENTPWYAIAELHRGYRIDASSREALMHQIAEYEAEQSWVKGYRIEEYELNPPLTYRATPVDPTYSDLADPPTR